MLRRPPPWTVAVACAALVLPACGDADEPGDAEDRTITIGYVTSQTGPLAPFGDADRFVVDRMRTFFANNRIVLGGEEHDVRIVIKDTQSDPARTGEVTAELIDFDGADLVLGQLAAPTPGTTNPVSDTCEAKAVPCITTTSPWEITWFGRGKQTLTDEPFRWSYHFFWGLQDVQNVFQDIWTRVGTNQQVGVLWPDDANGQAWASRQGGFPPVLEQAGYTLTDPGFYPPGSQDFAEQIAAFSGADAQALLAVPLPSEFAAFWRQAREEGYTPRVATVGRALLFPSTVEALGDAGDGLSTEVWWSPAHPFTSSLTNQSAAELAAQYEQQTGEQWTQPIGFVHALFEVAVAALRAADGTDGQALADALSALRVSTVVGELAWGPGPVPNVALTPLVGGQWRRTPGEANAYRLDIVSNARAPQIPVAGDPQPLTP